LFLYNYVTKMGGDMVRCGSNANDTGDNCFTAYHYVGRNVTHQNGENAVDVKKAWKTVVSENVMYDMSYIPSAAPIVTAHYYPNYTWFINNIIHTGDYNGLETGAGMQPTNQVWLVGNVIYNLGESGIYFRGVPIVHMYGNSVYDCEWGFEVTDSGSGPTVRATNNIISDCNLYALLYPNSTARGNAQIGYDCYYKTGGGNLISWNTGYTSVASWIAAVTTGDNSIGGDPLFVSAGSANFKLQASSPCIGAGDSSNWSFIEAQFLEQFGFALNYHDLAGNTRVNDIGAYEYVSTVQKSKSTGRLKLSGKGKL
jgi:hypothetical protein